MKVLITGTAQGIGQALANQFLDAGYLVFACDIQTDHSIKHERYIPVLMDMSSDQSVESARKQIESQIESLDLIIHNAGITDYFPLVENPTERIRHIVNINAFGLHRLCHQFWKHLPEGKGKIISISSESVGFPGPFQPYQISKISLEALHESLRQELMLKGIQMTIVRPGAMKTKLMEQLYDMDLSESSFKPFMSRFAQLAPKYTGTIRPPEKLAKKILKIAEKEHPRKVYRLYNNPLLRLMGWMPSRLKDYFLRKSLEG